MKHWRPEKGWGNPYKEARLLDEQSLIYRLPDGRYIDGSLRNENARAYEAGADALLNALKEVKSGYLLKRIVFGEEEDDVSK